jgi:type VI secretion system secreted protein VgrG
MTSHGEKRFTFVSDAQAEDTFLVVRFSGYEAISQPYRFEIELATDDAEIDLRAMLQKPAHFVIRRGDLDDRVFNGVLAEFEQMKESGGHVIYKAVLVPWLWNAGLYHENQLFLDKSVEDIIKEILQQTRLTGDDYKFQMTGAYTPWEYLCQWRETDLNFIHRWMEREGIYYYFSQDDKKEKLIITDNAASHKSISAESKIPYSPPSGTVPHYQEVIQSMVCRQHKLPNMVILRDYNYRHPSLELKAEATVDADGHGDVYFYGEHFKTPEEGNHLANIRAEELLCRECVYNGESTAANFSAGYLFDMQDHYRASYNQKYLLVEVEHQGQQAISGLSGQDSALSRGEHQLEYSNRFTAIPADVQFRPERSAVKPKFFGTLNATVDASGNGEYAEIDDQGRYKVILPFDRSGIGGGRASRWIRMTQPYAGNGYGMHFPLHRGTEVLLTFVDGDPDRPIISGSVPNPETASPVNTANQTQSMIRTGGGNQFRLEDNAGGQQIHFSSPTEGSIISLGAPNEGNLYMKTDGTSVMKVGSDSARTITGNEETTIKKNNTKTVDGDDTITINKGNRKIDVAKGSESITVKKDRSIDILNGSQTITVQNGDRTIKVLKGMETTEIKGPVNETYKTSQRTTVTRNVNIESKESHIELTAKTQIKLKVGESQLIMKSDGTIELKGVAVAIDGANVGIHGDEVTSKAGGKNTTMGDTTLVKGSSTATLQGGMVLLNP